MRIFVNQKEFKIGGTNLLRDSALTAAHHSAWSTKAIDNDKSSNVDWLDDQVTILNSDIIQNLTNVKPNTTYTFSFSLEFQDISYPGGNQFFFVEYADQAFSKTTNIYEDHKYTDEAFNNTSGRIDKSWTFTTQPDCHALKVYVRQEKNGGAFRVKNLKLEMGDVATDWSPAPEDIFARIDELSSKIGGVIRHLSACFYSLVTSAKEVA